VCLKQPPVGCSAKSTILAFRKGCEVSNVKRQHLPADIGGGRRSGLLDTQSWPARAADVYARPLEQDSAEVKPYGLMTLRFDAR
jgi:hypothetical protein